MSNISLQIEKIIFLINNLNPYSHITSYPFTQAYKNILLRSVSASNTEDCFRHYSVSIEETSPISIAALDIETYAVTAKIEVLYPFFKQSGLAAKYFSEESIRFKKVLEQPANFANEHVRLVSMENNRIIELDETRLIFEYEIYMIINELL